MPTAFETRVYQLCAQVPKGKVTTYKAIAEALGKKSYQAVGNALNKNPYAPQVPCHRVINATGRVGGFAQGTAKKIVMLRKEGITITHTKIKIKEYLYSIKG